MDISVNERIIKVIEKVTGNPVPNINFDSTITQELDLDSVKIIELFAALEEEFEIELPLKMMQVRTANEFLSELQGALSVIE